MKKVAFIIALVCVLLIVIFTADWFNVLAAPYEVVDDGIELIDIVHSRTSIKEEARKIMPVATKVVHSPDAIMLAQLVYGEAPGVYSLTEQACVMWTVLNRIDIGDHHGDSAQYGDSIEEIITSGAYYYESWFGTTDHYGRDLIWLAEDVLDRWEREKAGETDVGRVLPADYLWFCGDGEHNYFRNAYESPYDEWDYSLPSPYES